RCAGERRGPLPGALPPPRLRAEGGGPGRLLGELPPHRWLHGRRGDSKDDPRISLRSLLPERPDERGGELRRGATRGFLARMPRGELLCAIGADRPGLRGVRARTRPPCGRRVPNP